MPIFVCYNFVETFEKYTVVNQFMKSTSDVLGVSRQRINYCSRVLLTELGELI